MTSNLFEKYLPRFEDNPIVVQVQKRLLKSTVIKQSQQHELEETQLFRNCFLVSYGIEQIKLGNMLSVLSQRK